MVNSELAQWENEVLFEISRVHGSGLFMGKEKQDKSLQSLIHLVKSAHLERYQFAYQLA